MGKFDGHIYHGYPVICKNISPLCIMGVNYCDRSLHIGSLDPTFIQNFMPIPLMVFEILGFKLKNKNDNNKKNWKNKLFAISPIFVAQFSLNLDSHKY